MRQRSAITSSNPRRSALRAALLGFAFVAGSAHAVDWSKATAADVTVFYPGQQSWEKTLIKSNHKGADKIRAGEGCGGECHGGEEADMGAAQAEATGFTGRSSLVLQVRAAVEGGAIHWQISGPAAAGKPSGVAIMLGTDVIKSTPQAGCWAACHDDAPGMASDSGQDLGKYLGGSRVKNTATGGGAGIKPQADLDAALAAGAFLELIEVEADGTVERGHVLDRFNEKKVAGAATVRIEGDRWVTEVSRPLAAAGAGEIALEPGKVYNMGLAVHDPGVKKHEHLVSLRHTLAIGSGTADVVAASQ